MNKILNKINKNRQTVKEYSNKKISKNDWKQILESIYWAPSSLGFEPYRVLIIEKDNTLRKKLTPLMWNQGTIEGADKLVLFISKNRKAFLDKDWIFKRALRFQKEVKGLSGEKAIQGAKSYANVALNVHLLKQEPKGDDWSMKQAYIGLGMAMSAAAVLKIGSTPIEGADKKEVEKLLIKNNLINNNERLAVSLAFGYPASKKAYAHFGSGKRIRDSWEDKFKTI